MITELRSRRYEYLGTVIIIEGRMDTQIVNRGKQILFNYKQHDNYLNEI